MTRKNRILQVAEPPARYLQRPPLVVDCSVLAALLFLEPQAGEALARIDGYALQAPLLLDHEFASVALKKKRTAGLQELTDAALEHYAQCELTLHRTDIVAQVRLAERYDLTVYDAAYLWLADVLRAPLASFDQQLVAAARRHFDGLPGQTPTPE